MSARLVLRGALWGELGLGRRVEEHSCFARNSYHMAVASVDLNPVNLNLIVEVNLILGVNLIVEVTGELLSNDVIQLGHLCLYHCRKVCSDGDGLGGRDEGGGGGAQRRLGSRN